MKTIELFQWDLNQKIPCQFPEVHFASIGSSDALIVSADGGNASIPNILLQEPKDINVWFMEDGSVADSGKIRIIPRAKPADYVYTETEVITFESLVAKVEDVIAKANTAVDNATTAANKADEAALKANVASNKAAQAEVEIKASEARRVEAEQGRAEAEATRAANESKRTKSFNTNITSWNSKVDAAIAKVQTATDNATAAANKAEAAVSKLPLPLGNTLKGEAEATLVHVDDAYPAPLITTKVMGQSNQTTTTGKNLMRLINSDATNGVNLTANGDGSYHVKGTQTAGFTRFYTDNGIKKPLAEFGLKVGDTVYLSAAEASSKLYLAMFFFDEKGSSIYTQVATSASATEYTIAENVTQAYVCISLDGSVGTSVDSDFHPMISLSNNKDWEPYTGGKPSPSPDYPQEITNLNKAEIVTCGKNLINFGTIQSNRFNEQFNDAEMLSELNKLPRNIPLWLSCNVEPKGINNGEIWFEGEGNNKLGIMRQDKAYIVPEGEIKSFRLIGGINDASTRTYSNIQIAAVKSDFTNSDKAKHTPIDLKGNELCSLPHGVKDEVVIDAEGNVSLIKRTKQHSWNCVQIINGTGRNYAVDKVLDIGANYTGLVAEKAINATNNDIGICYVNQKMIYVTVPKSVTTKEQANQLYGGMKVIYQLAEPQTIPLGKVELPALPESTSNVWNNGNIPASVYIQYLKDVNIAYGKLESQLSQMAMALSMMDTPTIIPEISEDEPTLIPELEESLIEKSSITK